MINQIEFLAQSIRNLEKSDTEYSIVPLNNIDAAWKKKYRPNLEGPVSEIDGLEKITIVNKSSDFIILEDVMLMGLLNSTSANIPVQVKYLCKNELTIPTNSSPDNLYTPETLWHIQELNQIRHGVTRTKVHILFYPWKSNNMRAFGSSGSYVVAKRLVATPPDHLLLDKAQSLNLLNDICFACFFKHFYLDDKLLTDGKKFFLSPSKKLNKDSTIMLNMLGAKIINRYHSESLSILRRFFHPNQLSILESDKTENFVYYYFNKLFQIVNYDFRYP